MKNIDTKQKIMIAAERMFAKKGYGGTSIRNIVQEANVNLGAIHYHFGSKENLFLSILSQRLNSVNEERLRLLQKAEASGNCVTVEQIIRSFLMPIIHMQKSNKNHRQFSTMVGRAFSEDIKLKLLVEKQLFKPICDTFIRALEESMPDVPSLEVHWKFHFLICTMIGTFMAGDRLRVMSDGVCDSSNIEDTIHRLINFVTAGIKA